MLVINSNLSRTV